MAETWLIVSATSGLGRALCHVMAARGCALVITGRQVDTVEKIAAELRSEHGATVWPETFDAEDDGQHAGLVDRAWQRGRGRLDGAVICHGLLLDQRECEQSSDLLRRSIDVNFTSAAVLLDRLAERMIPQRSGTLAAISSVAGDCGRQSNYAYGAAKAGLSAYLQGLRNRLFRHGIHVLTIKPGFVDTPMIHGRVNVKSPLVASPERVARDIDRALRRQRDVLYTPWWWRIILGVICALPESIFKRLRF
ncbi:MAG: SDR family NAD(P)-dependent oxidoreductase [Planctomycetes bacterium]|nr:SDR family NAD(P)-dependent oxidoreductase [Planctomycetota bacterium]